MRKPKILNSISERLTKVELPWTFAANIPFSVTVKKPRPSLSKHDEHHEIWNYDDGIYLAMCVNHMPEILDYIKYLELKVQSLEGGNSELEHEY